MVNHDCATDAVGPATGIRKAALLGNHLPRQCGIATFTTDLTDAVASEVPDVDLLVLAMNDPGRRHAYPPRVRFEIAESDLASYRRAADFLNVNTVDVVCVQHEYGIFGGKAGGHLLTLLRELRMPIVTTLHTIVGAPSALQRRVLEELAALSERLVVMSAHGAELLREVHGVPPGKIDVIPHGIPVVPTDHRSKDRLGVEGRSVILTFGLLSPGKGIEHVIDAMPSILAERPEAVYVVLGATHPHVREQHGDSYRLSLESRAKRLGVDASLVFHDRFVTPAELAEFMAAADVYVTPYLNPEQITSGTLAYAVGCGKAVVSTPYRYARELLAEGRGVLVPWNDPAAIGREIVGLLSDDGRRSAMQARAAEFGRAMAWPAVARSYVASFERARADHAGRLRSVFQARTLARRPAVLPEVDLDHVERMTDSTGILQHALFSVPRYEDGYCLDDNARALLFVTLLEDAGTEDIAVVRALSTRYLAFVSHAYRAQSRRFRNFLSYSRRWTADCGSEDCHGRALWALGTVVGRAREPDRQSLGGSLFHDALPAVTHFTSPRAWAYALLGIDEYLRAFQGDRSVQAVRSVLAKRLFEMFGRVADGQWPWFEDRLTYCNARLSQALMVSGARMDNPEMTSVGLRSLDWLASLQSSDDGCFAPVGSNGFYVRGETMARFDQQPVEACTMVSACLEAYRLTGRVRWADRARCAFDWFLGHNMLKCALHDPSTGGCRDGLHADRANENQGAESTLSYLVALLEMRAADRVDVAPSVALELA
jgi:glycosyltransferase involved in cell wall biosynthesis